MKNRPYNKTAENNLRTGRVATPQGKEWTRLLRGLAVQCQLQTSPVTQPLIRYIHTTVPHFHPKCYIAPPHFTPKIYSLLTQF